MNKLSLDKFQPAFVFLILLFTYFIYSPGFSGTFLFDDGVNFRQFVEIRVGSEGLWEFLRYTGRPLAYLSFMLNDYLWPTTPESFIQTNVLLHLLTACLLMCCIILIGKNLGWNKSKRESIAMFSAFIWMIHPLLVSTVLYIVQRMTILSAIFVLIGLISYLYGRLQLVNKGNIKGWFWLVFATPVFGAFGVLCKESAALLPFYILVFEITLFSKDRSLPRYFFVWRNCYTYIAIIIVCLIMAQRSTIEDYAARDFDLIERLLTQTNILIHYLFLVLIPRSSTNGLHYENYPISTSLIEPLITLPAVIFIITIIFISIIYRKKYPIVTFAMLFFFFGHFMESTYVPLELFFEHRNYLPSMMFFFALSYGLYKYYDRYKRNVIVAAFTIVLLFSSLTYARAELWGNPLMLLGIWTENNPGSSRNYIEGHVQSHRLKRPDLATGFLKRGINALPDNIFLRIGFTSYSCGNGTLLKSDVEKLKNMLAETEEAHTFYLYQNLELLLNTSFKANCEFLTDDDLREAFHMLLENPNIEIYENRRHEILHLIGHLELKAKNYSEARKSFLESLLLNVNASTALQQVALFGTYGQYKLAHDYLIETRDLIYGEYNEEQRVNSRGWDDFLYLESIIKEELKTNL